MMISMLLSAAFMFIALLIVFKSWRAMTIGIMLSVLLSVFAPVLGALLALPILVVGLTASLLCFVVDEKRLDEINSRFMDSFSKGGQDEEVQQ